MSVGATYRAFLDSVPLGSFFPACHPWSCRANRELLVRAYCEERWAELDRLAGRGR